ncbi:MAG TPA: lipase family protein [Candidatus Sulfotelmatobacter sp.]|nr:lipase family protein [Candidatus Sulfotelmatobacter sp.]
MTHRALLVSLGCIFLAVAPAALAGPPQSTSDAAQPVRERLHTFPLGKFYDTSHITPGKPGDLIRSQEFDRYDLADGVAATRILYHSRAAGGQDVPVSGVVLYPDSKPPAQGWPVIAWAHALDGVARQCAPSLSKNVQHGPFLSMYVKLGYAVVATDYAGLGAGGRNAFVDAQSNATDVIYSVPAARAAVHGLQERWVAIGMGQGSPAVIAVAELEHDLRDPNYLGSVAVSGLEDLQERYQHAAASTFYDLPLFLAFGIKTDFPQLELKDLLTEQGMALYPRVEQSCAEPVIAAKLSPAEILKPNWADNKFVKLYLSRSALGEHAAQRPVMVISSELDSMIPIRATEQVISRLCKQGDEVEFERLPQSDPGSVFGDSVRDQIAWIQSRFAGRKAESNCGQQH